MSASRKLYVAASNRLAAVGKQTDENDRHIWRQTVAATAAAFKEDNSGFDTQRFLRASGFVEQELSFYQTRS